MADFDLALLILRASVGLSIAAHGLNKCRGGLKGTEGWFKSIGMRHPRLQALTAASGEIVAGVLLTLGLLTTPACVVITALMVVAIVTVHWKVGYFIFLPNGGWEYCASIIAVVAAIALVGPGSASLDNAWDISITYGAWAVPVGTALALCHVALFFRPPTRPGQP